MESVISEADRLSMGERCAMVRKISRDEIMVQGGTYAVEAIAW